eukprot:COSAG05_NODE_1900_length_3858_cov_2.298218_1_plen_899_part_10
MTIQGRSYVALGRASDATHAFEAAAETARVAGFWLLEAFALRDLKLLVLDQLEHGEHGSRRLGVALRLLTGPAETLTPVLKGLDATELMSLPPPQPEYVMAFSEDDSVTTKLRLELKALRSTALQKRALAAGIAQEAVEEAVDSENPKVQLIELIVQQNIAKESGEKEQREALRQELQGLKPMALQRRAVSEGIAEQQLELAIDSDDPKTALIELLLTASTQDAQAGASSKPHFSGAGQLVEPSQPANRSTTEDVATVKLREELQTFRLSALQKRATQSGVDQQAIEQALDSVDPKVTLVALIVDASETNLQSTELLRTQLQGLGLSTLQRRATEGGVAAARIDKALDADNPKAAIVELLLAMPTVFVPTATSTQSSKARPHFGAKTMSAGPTATSYTKHVMLSYQWDHQREVKRVFDLLTRLGLNVWMDINGGMGVDVYESMAEGVSNASVLVCFMSQKYQESTNCMLEVKFAKQSGIEIVPVLMEGGGWKATSYLGLLTAGALWTPLYDEATFENNVQMLHGQLVKVIGRHAVELEGEVGLDLAVTVSEAHEELERLREEVAAAGTQAHGTVPTAAMMSDPSQPATIPAGVPKLPARFQPTEQILELTRLVLSTAPIEMAKPRVGFFGMGGIGKTVTGAAIVRNEDVRLHFDGIVWLPLGQTPMIAKLQNLCHMQCTGKELSAELSSEEKKQALQQAMAGKKILLCLDDLWEEVHETELNFADVDAGSKVLISTRIKGLLAEAHQVEVGLPSMADSARMLLAAAGVEDVAEQSTPSGVGEIVELCGRLPLALGIAGRLAASLGLVGTNDWGGMIGVLKEELRESHSGGTEEGMIRASLRGLKGSAAEQESVKALLLMFALVPEDTHCPLEVLLLMFQATVLSRLEQAASCLILLTVQ